MAENAGKAGTAWAETDTGPNESHQASFDFVIVGATGDLTMRKLLPAFFERFRMGQIADDTKIIGVARSDLSVEVYRERARSALSEFSASFASDNKDAEKFLELVHYVSLDASDTSAEWRPLETLLSVNPQRVRVFYVATAPKLYVATADAIADHGLITATTRIVLEKPIGTDFVSARAINDGVGRHFAEEQIFRIDHYIGKQTVQNILALRFANPILERVWNADSIAHVQITATETVGVGKRGPYYDTAGALRDMVQNHLLQVLSLVAMEPPTALSAMDLRDEKLKILRALKPMDKVSIASDTVRAQYVAGMVDGKRVDGYLEDLGSDASNTETFLAIRAEIRTTRWAGVPFYLRTGKRMAHKESEVVIEFRPQPWAIFKDTPEPNRLVLRIQPDEGVSLSLSSKDPLAEGFRLRDVNLDVSYIKTFGTRYPDSYEDLLMAVVRGDQVLFIRRDEVQASWRWIEPVLDGWAENVRPMETYPAGSRGPASADELLRDDGFVWKEKT
ncbi:glucose-6-phosphate dehydrogenase [Acetobacter oeni]|uniref:Glucose-6-phosphate 1-dehydrogenase n=1 Tax=Acetobacter oeni TaxID=304077 RepID=A0A511XJW6_9PROT|nr:glucose-6-phosphate dehydrogenase [Acetobacter oeni]MBB3883462.1 glucose-6-phosphate 1-dehydrogenase [Acetobacter oeni]NHO19432.1 glucose-6-phosphate dehydrogenase [Acetobacter oeni]GBR04068.1 glucose-6-phosphate 1-dehydrogenase [Acetobacter oeni LMG 21952]GEN63243.1 glucose-6-phosphate 1-dehydrogenase [Acetobacter oeni]